MKLMLMAVVSSLIVMILAAVIMLATIAQGIVTPPLGMLNVGPLSIMSVRLCPQVWPPQGWSRPCGEEQPWALLAVVRWPQGEIWQQELLNIDVNH